MNKSLASLTKTEMAEKYIEILQPLEYLVAINYQDFPEMRDSDVLKAYESILKDIRAKLTNFPLPQHKLEGIANFLYLQLTMQQETFEIGTLYSLVELQACFKQVEKSVKMWTREFGSRGYLNFISQFNPI